MSFFKSHNHFLNGYNNKLFTDEDSKLSTEQLEKLFKASGTRGGAEP